MKTLFKGLTSRKEYNLLKDSAIRIDVRFLVAPQILHTYSGEMQKRIDIEAIALQFNDCINDQNLDGLVNLMTDNHVFIDSANNHIIGISSNKENWQNFFDLFPDYRNIFEVVSSTDSTVIMQGYSVCSNNILNNVRAIWVARINCDKLEEWRVYLDNEENRKKFRDLNCIFTYGIK